MFMGVKETASICRQGAGDGAHWETACQAAKLGFPSKETQELLAA